MVLGICGQFLCIRMCEPIFEVRQATKILTGGRIYQTGSGQLYIVTAKNLEAWECGVQANHNRKLRDRHSPTTRKEKRPEEDSRIFITEGTLQ